MYSVKIFVLMSLIHRGSQRKANREAGGPIVARLYASYESFFYRARGNRARGLDNFWSESLSMPLLCVCEQLILW